MNKILSMFLVLVLAVGFVSAAKPVTPTWDKSSVKFGETDLSCGLVSATVCNDGSDMAGSTNYYVYYSEAGNAKDGSIVDDGTLQLKAGECTTLTYASEDSGSYAFKVDQRPGHPGEGVAWSSAIAYDSELCNEVPEFGVIAGGLALIGALGVFIYRRN